VGGTRLKSGAVTPDGRLVAPHVQPSGYAVGADALVDLLDTEVRRLTDVMGGPATGVCLGFPGAVDPEQGVVLLPGKLKGLEGYPIVPRLRERIGRPVIAENDGRLTILAEAFFGRARGRAWAMTVTIGTGVGSGVMLDGRILRDPHLQFGTQLSHMVLQALGGRLCLTGARGTAEMMCSATALAMAVRDGLQRGIPSVLSDAYFDDPVTVDFEAVIRAVGEGDRLCIDELQQWTQHLCWMLVSAVHLYAPEVIILSGGATHAAPYFLEAVREQVNAHVFRYPPGEPVEIVLSELRDHSGVLGAGASAWEAFEPSWRAGRPGD
jgi:glucokinase